ncbi:TPA: hypothetical protein ACJLX9_001847 [Neisseria meningitidis]
MPSEAGFVASDGIAATPSAGRLFLPARFRFGICRKLIPKKFLINGLDCRVQHRRYEQAQYRQSYDECRLPDKNRMDCLRAEYLSAFLFK